MSADPVSRSIDALRVPSERLRWRCDPGQFDFATTDEIAPIEGVIGQDDAMEALTFGLEVHAPGQHIFVRGLVGTGRLTLVRQLLTQIQPGCPAVGDLCYVHDFDNPARPRLITLRRGQGPDFRERIHELADFIRDELAPALSSDNMRGLQSALEKELQKKMAEVSEPFEVELRENDLAVVTLQMGESMQPAVFPVLDGKPTSADQLEALVGQGTVSAADADRLRDKVRDFSARFAELGQRLRVLQEGHRAAVRQLYENETRRILRFSMQAIEAEFDQERVRTFLRSVVEDVIQTRLRQQDTTSTRRYRVNLILGHDADADEECPIIVENTPSLRNLLGAIDRTVTPQGGIESDHTMISAGSLLRAHGGYLVMEAGDVLAEPGAWKFLVRTLRTGKLEIVPHDSSLFGGSAMLQPEPIDVDVKVVLLGDPGLFHQLDALDPDFRHLFKVLADFDSSIPRDDQGLRHYAGVLARLARDEKLLPFGRDACAELAEHGARIAGRQDRLTARFGRLGDLAREASFLADRRARDAVSGEDVIEAVRRSKRRAGLPARKFVEHIRDGRIRIQTQGMEVGQINGLAVTQSGQLSYGFPARITATIAPGSTGTISIEREALLSGSIHTKGFYILGGLLRRLLRTPHPLTFSASVAFEQSYGGIDGDSASGAEICCLLSALTGIPLRQDVAMTGAIDQLGNLQPIGAANEKAEGFFDICRDAGLTGTQGVLLPAGNAIDLMLRRDVVAACDAGEFHVWTADTIQDALEILTGRVAGEIDEAGRYPEGTLLREAMEQATEFWKLASAHPSQIMVQLDTEDPGGPAA